MQTTRAIDDKGTVTGVSIWLAPSDAPSELFSFDNALKCLLKIDIGFSSMYRMTKFLKIEEKCWDLITQLGKKQILVHIFQNPVFFSTGILFLAQHQLQDGGHYGGPQLLPNIKVKGIFAKC